MSSTKERNTQELREARRTATIRSRNNVIEREVRMEGKKRVDPDRPYLHSSVYPVTPHSPVGSQKRKVPERPPIEQCNVLFINPTINPHTQNDILNSVIRTSFPMSLGYVAGYLIHKGVSQCYIVDEMIDGLDDIMLEGLILAMPKPRIVAFSVLTATCGPAYILARKIRKIDPDTAIIMGGVHITVVPEEPLKNGTADVAVIGEGELTFTELASKILKGEDYHDVAGIAYQDADGKCVRTGERALPRDLDEFPPYPYFLFAHNADKYGIGFSSILTSRGCPYKCTFCSQRSMTALTYRYHSNERALQDIITLVEDFDAKTIQLIDDNIAVNKKRLMSFLDSIIEAGLHEKVEFQGSMRADNMDDEIYDRLREANFTLLAYGMETGVERIMAQMQKGETVQDVADAIKASAKKGFTVATTLIFGFPGETLRDRWQTIKLVFSLPLDSVRFNILTPYPGTPIYHEIMDSDEPMHIADDWANFSVQYMWEGSDMPYIPKGTNRYALIFITMFANLWYYMRPAGIWKMMTTSVAGGNVVPLPEGWYRSRFLFFLMRVGFYLVKRFVGIFGMMLLTTPWGWLKRLANRRRSSSSALTVEAS